MHLRTKHALRFVFLLLILGAFAAPLTAQDMPDSDGDTVPDAFDSCAQQAGVINNNGCPADVIADFDADTIPDSDDLCTFDAGTADLRGCTPETFPDTDQDTIPDIDDACFDQPGVATNSGCPDGVTPDLDRDGVPDPSDPCPRDYGDPGGNGCPPDADADTVADYNDACPQEAGIMENIGCPEGVTPPDADGDAVPDLYDGCPQEAGVGEGFGGCPDTDGDGLSNLYDSCPETAGDQALGGCLDADGDLVPDPFDSCPNEAGAQELSGCLAVTSGTLIAPVAPITSANAASVSELGRLTVGAPSLALSGSNRLAVRAANNLYLYDVAPSLAPAVDIPAERGGSPITVSGDGAVMASVEFPASFDEAPFVQIWNGNGERGLTIVPEGDGQYGPAGLTDVLLNRAGTVLAVSVFRSLDSTPIELYDVATGTRLAQLAHPNPVSYMAFSPDGTRLATSVQEGDAAVAGAANFAVYIWDVATGTQVGNLNVTQNVNFSGTPLAFSPDGALLAVGKPDGTVGLWDVTAGTERYSTPLFNTQAQEVVSAVAYSPDGSVIAAAGGVPFSGGLTGTEVFGIVLLDAATGQLLTRIEAHNSLILDVMFSGDGTLLLSTGDATIRFWGVAQ